MKARILTLALLLPAAALLVWRVEWDRTFLPARLQQDMTERSRTPRPHPAGAIPFEGNKQAVSTDLLYRQHCAACHGENGAPPPHLATFPGMPQIPQLCPPPPDTSTWEESISQGRGAMPAYAALLSPEQIRALIAYIPTLEQKASAPPPRPKPRAAAQTDTPPPRPVRLHWAWGRAWISFLLSLPLGLAFLRGIMPHTKGAHLPGAFEKSLALSLGSAAVGTLAGLALWGSAAFALPALAFAGGLSCHALLKRGSTEPYYPALQTTALAIAAYALAIPWLVGSYLPGNTVPGGFIAAHAGCFGAILGLALLLPIGRWRTPWGIMLHAVAVLLVLAWAHALLSTCIR